MRKHDGEDSRHFKYIWEKVILPVVETVEQELDREFYMCCGLVHAYRSEHTWKKAVYKEYWKHREALKKSCYGIKAQDGLLDHRKLAAVLSKTFLTEKAFSFDVVKAAKYAEEKKSDFVGQAYTRWAIDNVLINYKVAYLVGVQFVYVFLLEKLLEEGNSIQASALLERGRLFHYPVDSKCDNFDVNVVLALARADVMHQELNMLLYAMQLYQMEMYTRQTLSGVS